MKNLVFNQQQLLRNGWWILIFIAFTAISRVLYPYFSNSLQSLGVSKEWLAPLSVIFIVIVTWACLLLRQQSLANVGLNINSLWLKHLMVGSALGGMQVAIIVALMVLTGAVQFQWDNSVVLSVLLMGFYTLFFAALLEEILFRGFVFQRLIDGIGFWPAQITLASLFSIGHISNPEVNQDTIIFATLDIALASILYGIAYIKTKSLALPLGLHFGWNWSLGNIFGFEVSGYAHQGILQPILLEKPAWLTGGGFGPEATIYAVLIDVIFILVLWRWQSNPIEETPSPLMPSFTTSKSS